jgi:hypothetical protein
MQQYRIGSWEYPLSTSIFELEKMVYLQDGRLIQTDKPDFGMLGPIGHFENGHLHLNDMGLKILKERAKE